MRSLRVAGGVLVVLVAVCAGVLAQSSESDIVVGSIPMPKLAWGHQNVTFEMGNKGDWLKFVGVLTEVGAFDGSYTEPHRTWQHYYTIKPGDSVQCTADIDIPGNYGVCTAWVRVYELVDTLDDVTLGTQVMAQPFQLRFTPPEPMIKYRQEAMSVPPMMGRSRAFDSEFYRLFFLFLKQGKSIGDMAHIANVDPSFVTRAAGELKKMGYLTQDSSGGYVSKIPVIPFDEAEAVRKVVDETSDKLVAQVKGNHDAFKKSVDSLVAAGVVTANGKGSFMEGSSLLFRPHPLYSEMLLWYMLGTSFVTHDSGNLLVYAPHNLCGPDVGRYMYLVHGSDYYNGAQYFDANERAAEYSAYFSPTPPKIWCSAIVPGPGNDFRIKGQDWDYADDVKVESFFFDSAAVDPPLRALAAGTDAILKDAESRLEELHQKYCNENVGYGVRFWFWNLTATVTLSKMEKSGVIQRGSADMYMVSRLRK